MVRRLGATYVHRGDLNECARRFHERYFGFDPDQARSYPDGTLILRDADGLHPANG